MSVAGEHDHSRIFEVVSTGTIHNSKLYKNNENWRSYHFSRSAHHTTNRLLHYDSKLWGDDAKEFNPPRFSKGVSCAYNSPFSYIPFGIGPRNCPRQNYVITELKIALAFFLQSFSLSYPLLMYVLHLHI